jgi:hypothetical protein
MPGNGQPHGDTTAPSHERLLTYVRRWAIGGVLLLGAAAVFEFALSWRVPSALFYVLSSLTVPFNAVTVTCWGCLHFDLRPS